MALAIVWQGREAYNIHSIYSLCLKQIKSIINAIEPFVSKILFYRLTIEFNGNLIAERHVLFLNVTFYISECHVTISEPQALFQNLRL